MPPLPLGGEGSPALLFTAVHMPGWPQGAAVASAGSAPCCACCASPSWRSTASQSSLRLCRASSSRFSLAAAACSSRACSSWPAYRVAGERVHARWVQLDRFPHCGRSG